MNKIIKSKYIKSGGVKCPYCGSYDLAGGDFQADDNCVWREVVCCDCDKEWQDIYILTDIKEVITE